VEFPFQIQRGDFLGIVGPNGSGKTTILRCILGWVPPKNGKIQKGAKLRFGYVPQRNSIDALFPLNARDIVLMGLYSSRYPWQRILKKQVLAAEKALEQVGPQGKGRLSLSSTLGRAAAEGFVGARPCWQTRCFSFG